MTRIQKQRTRTIALFCELFTLATIFGCINYMQYSNHTTPDSSTDKMIFWACIVFCVVFIILITTLNRRKQPIVLTAEELHEPVVPYLELNNRFEWKRFIIYMISFLYALAVFLFPGLIQIAASLPVAFWALVVFACILPLIPFLMSHRNRYCIDGNTLIVQEYMFFKREPELRIPIDTISAVYLRNTWTLFPALFLDINGIQRQLSPTTYTCELAVAILQHKMAQQK